MIRSGPISWLLVLALLAGTQLGASCEPGTPQPAPNTWLRLEAQNVYPVGPGYLLEVSVFVESAQAFQAVDLSVDWQGDSLTVRPILDAEFDDDGVPFGPPLPLGVQTGPLALRDVRHATASPAGTVCVAQIWVFAPNGGTTTVDASGSLGKPSGSVIVAEPDSLSYTP